MPRSLGALCVMSNVGLTAEVGGGSVLSPSHPPPAVRDACTSHASPIPVKLPPNMQGSSFVLPGCSVLLTTDKEVYARSNVLLGLPLLLLVLTVQCCIAVQSLEEIVSPCLTSECCMLG